MTETSSFQSGDRVGNYRILELIGEGGMGKVFKARQISMDRIVALKVLSLKKEHLDPDLRKRFVNEARTAGKLNHENIIHVYDVAKTGDTLYFSMEYIDGESVGELLDKKKKFDVITALAITKGILNALVAAQDLGIVHRDIKPDNIIITKDGTTKLADLGLAKATDLEKSASITQEGVVMGTPHYMSPEQATGDRLDVRTDIYSLGATLYHMLTGMTPFKGKSSLAVISSVLKGGFPPPIDVESSVPARISEMVVKMMKYSPDDRYRTPQKVLKEIDEIENEASTATLFTKAYGLSKYNRKTILKWAGAVIGVVLLGSIVSAKCFFSQQEDLVKGSFGVVGDDHNVQEGDGSKEEGTAGFSKLTNDGSDEKPFSFIYGKLKELEDGRTEVVYDFSYTSQMEDWFRDTYWWRKQIKNAAKTVLMDMQEIGDRNKVQDLKKYMLKYLIPPHSWKMIDKALVNYNPNEVEGFVNKLSFSGNVTVEFTLEIKKSKFPSIIVSFMNDQRGNGLSFNIGKVGHSQGGLFIISENGEREKTENINIPFNIRTGVIYSVKITKVNGTVKLWISRGEKITDSEPVFKTIIEGYEKGHCILWSNRTLIKCYRVRIAGKLFPMNYDGWFERSGNWQYDGSRYRVTGSEQAEAVLEYRGLPWKKSFRIVIDPVAETPLHGRIQFFLKREGNQKGMGSVLCFGIKGNSLFIKETGKLLWEEGEGRQRFLKKGRKRNLFRNEMMLYESEISSKEDITLSVVYTDDGIVFIANNIPVYKEIRDYSRFEKVGIMVNTTLFLKKVSITKLSDG